MNIRFRSILFGWLCFSICITVLMYIVHPLNAGEFHIISEFQWELAFGISWSIATPVVFWLSGRFPVLSEKKITNAVILTAAGLVSSVVLCFFHAVAVYVLRGGKGEFSVNFVLVSFYYNIDKMLIVYAVLVVFQQAMTYSRELQHTALRSSQLETQLSQAQMNALRMQLQPHFLFNTLNSIVALIRKNPEQAEEMTIRLSDFLRLTLEGSSDHMISVEEEFKFIDSYMAIEQIRFGGRLDYRRNVQPEIMNAAVPLLVLQPIVENAIKHGISKFQDSHILEITGWKENNNLRFTISDDGIPHDEQFVPRFAEGVGIRNTKERISKLYGDKGSIRFAAHHPRGITAELLFPLP